MDARASFPADLASASSARKFAEAHLHQWSAEDLLEDTRLLVSELVINAVLHARTPADVALTYDEGTLRVEVHDGSTTALARRDFSTTATTGRGLMILEALAARWGVDTRPDGKVVWFELEHQPADQAKEPSKVRPRANPARAGTRASVRQDQRR